MQILPQTLRFGTVSDLAMSAWVPYFLTVLAAVLLFIVKTVAWGLFFVVLAVWWLQGYALYMPTTFDRTGEKRQVKFNPEGFRLPSESDLPFEEYFLQCADGVMIHTWFIPRPDRKNAPTLIFFHGNAGNIGNRLYNAKFLYHRAQCNTLLVEYRGYGNSQGSPSEYGFKLDALAALDFLLARTDIDTKQIFLFGRSLGGAVAAWLALERPQHIRGLILENTFTSVVDMFFVLLSKVTKPDSFERPLRFFLRYFMTSHWRTVDLMSRLSVPTLFVSGLDDELVPAAHMQALYDTVPDSCYKEFYGVAGGMHNTTYIDGGPSYWHVLHGFVNRIARGDTT